MGNMEINKEDYLKYILSNAFDFLERAIGQFAAEPKYSIINFCSAIELFLKSKLLKEHWSLVVAHKTMPDLKDFNKGDFRSEDFKDLIPKIRKVFNEDISSDIENCFKNLANNRNRMIHFYHDINVPQKTEEEIENLVTEQCKAWKYLKKLFEKWDDIFSAYSDKISRMDEMMDSTERKMFLEKKFKKLKEKIDTLKSKGAHIIQCALCEYESVIDTEITSELHEGKCLVCDDRYKAIQVKCPNEECDEIITIKDDKFPIDNIECQKCGEIIDNEYLKDYLCTRIVTKDNYFEINSINCADCYSMESGIVHHDYYLCLNCLNYSKYAAACEWCNEQTIGYNEEDMRDSYLTGCEFCDGHIGWHSDDD